jgi:hypothetical protein
MSIVVLYYHIVRGYKLYDLQKKEIWVTGVLTSAMLLHYRVIHNLQ